MSDDTTGSVGRREGSGEHQNIMSRILEYQRQLREGDPPPPPVETLPDRPAMDFAAAEALSAETADLVDLTEAEATLAAEPGPAPAVEGEGPVPETSDQGAPSEERAEEKVAPVVRLVEPPAPAEPRPVPENGVWAVPDPPAQDERNVELERIAELEEALRRVSQTITELRRRFQDMAVASDERLAELEEIVERARRSTRV
jgi:hypothetical protein